MGAQDSEVGMSQERRVYSKFRSPDLADIANMRPGVSKDPVSYTHLRAHETREDLVLRSLV